MLWRPPRRSWCMHRILCTACNRNSTRSFERGHDGNILEEAYRGRYARQRLLNFWPESSCGYHAIKRFVCIIQVVYDESGKKVEPFYFDARRAINAHSRDVGFSPNDLQLTTTAFPAV